MTRWHEMDLAGYLLSENDDDWEEIRLPAFAEASDPLGRSEGEALCPERYDVEALKRIRLAVGSRVWSALYQQSPTADEGNIIQRSWLKYYDEPPVELDEKAIFADLSFKEGPTTDFTVIEAWGRKGTDIYLIDQIRARMNFPDQVKAFRTMVSRHPDAFLKQIEEAANGAAIIATLTSEIVGLVPFKPKTSKEARLAAVSPIYEAGNVWYPNPKIAPWVSENLHELFSFPTGKHDDTVDCASQAVFYFASIENAVRQLRMLTVR
jgi:predicted phage terminase large subunit-like protein